MKKIYNHPQLGEITINRSSRARRVSVSVRASGITLTLPLRFPLEDALAFAESKQGWIEKAKKRTQAQIRPPLVVKPPFHTRFHELEVGYGDKAAVVIRERRLSVTLPHGSEVESPVSQEILRQAVAETLRKEAKHTLPGRVAELAGRWGFSYGNLSFRNTVSRWGSCSAGNSISLSINLMILPLHLIDYIILHELCHTIHKNHGAKFHALLERVTEGKHREWNRELKNYSPRW